ncbi:MAG: hypothetical protein WCT05_03050, partial [Lentisphaeria bacterium]
LLPAGWYTSGTDGFIYETCALGTWSCYKIWSMRRPASFMLLEDTVRVSDGMQYKTWAAHVSGSGPHFRHSNNLCNAIFVDGHAESTTRDRFIDAYRKGVITFDTPASHNLYLYIGNAYAEFLASGLSKL